MENAIEKARRIGWDERIMDLDVYNDCGATCYEIGLLDTLFWQALGKQQGWGKDIPPEDWLCKACYGGDCGGCEERIKENIKAFFNTKEYDWKHYWHLFIDHIAEGKDVDDFFNNLIK